MTEAVIKGVDRDQVVAGILAALTAVLEEDVDGLTAESKLSEVGLDSTGVLELLMQLEESLGVEFDTDNLDRKSTRLNSSHNQRSRMPSSA